MIVSKPATKEYRDNYDRTFKSPYDHYKVRGISKTKAKRKKKRG